MSHSSKSSGISKRGRRFGHSSAAAGALEALESRQLLSAAVLGVLDSGALNPPSGPSVMNVQQPSPAAGVPEVLAGSLPATTVSVLTSSQVNNTSVYGNSIVLTATVTGTGLAAPTGNVTFLDGLVIVGTGTLSSSGGLTSVATLSTSALRAGVHPLTVRYESDGDNDLSVSVTVSSTVSRRPVTLSGVTAANKGYDGSTNAVLDLSQAAISNIMASDSQNSVLNTQNATGTFASKNANTGILVTLGGFTLAGSAAANYLMTVPTLTADITPKVLTVTGISALDKNYNGSAIATLSKRHPALAGVVAGEQTQVRLLGSHITGAFANANAGVDLVVTVSGLSLTGVGSQNYVLAPLTVTATITPRMVSISGIRAAGKIFDGNTSVTPVMTSAGMTGVIAADRGNVTLNSANITGTLSSANVRRNIGVTIGGVALAGSAAGNYVFRVNTTTATVTAKAVTVTGIHAADKAYDGTTAATLDVSAATLSGVIGADIDDLMLVSANAVGTFSGRNAGSGLDVAVRGLALDGSARNNYTLTQPTTTADITARLVTVAGITASDKVYDGLNNATVVMTRASLSGLLGADRLTVRLAGGGATGTFSSANAGTGMSVMVGGLTLTGRSAGNYAIGQATAVADISAKALTVSGITASNKVYDRSSAAQLDMGDAVLSGVLSVDAAHVLLDTSDAAGQFSSANAGTGMVVTIEGLTLSGSAAGNYSVTAPTTTANITAHHVQVTGILAANKTYNGSTGATLGLLNAGLTGVLQGDVVVLETAGATGAFGAKNVGTGLTVTVAGLTLSGAAAANYSIDPTTATANITKKSLVATGITANNKLFDGTLNGTVDASHVALTGVLASDSASVVLDPGQIVGTFASAEVGTGIAVTASGFLLTGTAAGNYNVTPVALSADITLQNVTITGLIANSRAYDGSNAVTFDFSNAHLYGAALVDQNSVDFSNITGSFSGSDAGTGLGVTVSGIVLTGNAAVNYTLVQPTATASITAKVLTVSGVTAQDKVYDGTTVVDVSVQNAAVVGVVGGDNVTLIATNVSGAFSAGDVGTGLTVTVAGLSLGGASSGNYTLDATTTTAAITPKALTVAGITAGNKAYDRSTAATLAFNQAQLSGVVGNEEIGLTLTNMTGSFTSANVGNGKGVTLSNLTLLGTTAGNYTLTLPTVTANITAKVLSVSGITAQDRIYDGTTDASVSVQNAALSGVVNGDIVTLQTGNVSGAFSAADAGNGLTVTVAGLTLGGADSGNYTLGATTTTASITPKALTVTGITAENKVYDRTTAATLDFTSAQLSGVVGSEQVGMTLTNMTGAFNASDVGNGRSVTLSNLTLFGANAANYTLTLPTVTANITARVLTVSGINIIDKVYDGSNAAIFSAITAQLSGVVSGDQIFLDDTNAAATMSSVNVGSGLDVTFTGLGLMGSGVGNYTLAAPTLSGAILQKALTVSGIVANNKFADGTTAASLDTSGASLDGVLLSDLGNVALDTQNAIGNFEFADAYYVPLNVFVSGLTITGVASGNYSVTNPIATAYIYII